MSNDEMLMPISDVNDLDEVCAELGIQESDVTPAEAVRELKAELAQARADIAERDARLAVVVGVLEPFVAFIEKADGPVLHVTGHGGSHMGPGLMAATRDDYVLLRPDPSVPPLTLGHFRAARAVLSATKEG